MSIHTDDLIQLISSRFSQKSVAIFIFGPSRPQAHRVPFLCKANVQVWPFILKKVTEIQQMQSQ